MWRAVGDGGSRAATRRMSAAVSESYIMGRHAKRDRCGQGRDVGLWPLATDSVVSATVSFREQRKSANKSPSPTVTRLIQHGHS